MNLLGLLCSWLLHEGISVVVGAGLSALMIFVNEKWRIVDRLNGALSYSVHKTCSSHEGYSYSYSYMLEWSLADLHAVLHI